MNPTHTSNVLLARCKINFKNIYTSVYNDDDMREHNNNIVLHPFQQFITKIYTQQI